MYWVAKQQVKRCSDEEFGVALAEHFLAEHPKARARGVTSGVMRLCTHAAARAEQVSAAEVTVEQKPWARTSVGGQPHDHGACTSREHNISTARYSV